MKKMSLMSVLDLGSNPMNLPLVKSTVPAQLSHWQKGILTVI